MRRDGAALSPLSFAPGLSDGERLRLAESLLLATAHNTDAAIFVKDLRGRYVFANEKCERIWRRSRDEIVGKTDEDLLPAACAETIAKNDRATLDNGAPAAFEEAFELAHGKRVFVCLKAPLVDRSGRSYALCVVATDVTNRVRDANVLRASEAHFRALADNAPVLIWLSDERNKGTYFNQTWLSFTGRTLAEEVGDGWLDRVFPEDLSRLEECVRAFGERRPFQTSFRLRRYDGVYRWMLDTAVPMIGPDGAFRGFVGSMVDVTEARVLEQALERRTVELAERDRRKDEFMAVLAHELRNPLAALRGATDLLQIKQRAGGGAVSREVAVLDRQLSRLTRLVDDLLDVARLTRGKIQLSKRTVAVADIVELASESVSESIQRRGQRLDVELPLQPVTLSADPMRLAQVLTNLVLNASKYSPVGSVIRLAVRLDEDLEIRVEDQGIGIPEALLTSVFEPFFQAQHDYKQLGDGLGLGLTLVRTVVEMHGGTVFARSAGPARGSVFVVRLPASQELPRSDRAALSQPRAAASRSVLVVDDNADSAELLAELLRLRGHRVETALDGRAAVERAKELEPEVVLLDLGLPGLDGFGVARELRARFGDRIRLVAVTGYGRSSDRNAANDAGFDAYLVKPVHDDVLLAAVSPEEAAAARA